MMANGNDAKPLQPTTIEEVTNIARSAPLVGVTIEDRYFAIGEITHDDFVRITADGNKIVAKQPVEDPYFSWKAMLRAGDPSFSGSDWDWLSARMNPKLIVGLSNEITRQHCRRALSKTISAAPTSITLH